MWISLERQVAQVFERAISTLLAERAGEGVAPQDLGHFEIAQMRSVERLAGEEEPFGYVRRVAGAQEQLEDRGGVDDDRARARSARTARAGETRVTAEGRLASRRRSSSRVGRSAMRRTSLRR